MMKKLLILFVLLLMPLSAIADTFYCVIKVKYPAIVGYYQDDESEPLPELVTGKTYCEITEAEYSTQTVPQAKIDTAVATYNAEHKDFTVTYKQLEKAFALVVLDEINKLRVINGDTPYTVNQLKTAVSNKYDTL